VLSGRERGKRGVVREVRAKDGTALVQDLNISKRHLKPSGGARQAGIIDKEQPIHLSNLALVDPKSSKPTRVRARELTTGKKVRIAVASGEQIGKE
jgi:large subunit ribosomal protein L24